MTDNHEKDSTQGWDTYWRGAEGSDAFTRDGFSHPGLSQLWTKSLNEFLLANVGRELKFLDIGTGSGAVVSAICQHPAVEISDVSCVDISAAAIDGIQKRFAGLNGVVADASDIPLENESFNLITSQFGIEYAGIDAFDEAVRLLAPNGTLLFILHIADGALYRECGAAIDALQRVASIRFLELTRDFFETGFAAVRGADRSPYEAAASAMNPAIRELEAILTEHGEHVAGDTIVSLLTEVQKVHSRIQYYEPDEVLAWLDKMQDETPKQCERMESMQSAALNEESFKSICDRLGTEGLNLVFAQPAHVEGEKQPIAWILQANR